MHELKNSNNDTIPQRPSLSDNALKKVVVERGVHLLYSSKGNPFRDSDRTALIQSLNKHYHLHIDTYALAKYFEIDSWDVDAEFIDSLDCVIPYIEEALRAATMDWYKIYQPVSPFKIGAQIKQFGYKDSESGVIESISEDIPATYRVKPLQGHNVTRRLLIKFEDAVLVA
ncbi:hypothetical protein [Vibrio owensii]|uniref:hypothetical protein n=1 Tax=Vibrio owensii TaxID=696485 RepID=UPI0040692BF0